MKVYRVIHIDGELSPEDWSWVPNQIVHPRAAEALFVTSSVDQALAWALHLYTNLDEPKTHILELEVKCIRDFNLNPTKRWLKAELCAWYSDHEMPFDHPRFERVRAKWASDYGDLDENSGKPVPYLLEGLFLPEDLI